MTWVTWRALKKSYGKKRRKRCIFRWLRKKGKDDVDVTWRGRSFQVRAAATGKARSPTVDSCVRWTGSDVVSANRRRVLIPRSAAWRSSSARIWIRSGAFSQWRQWRSGVMWLELDDENTSWAAKFKTIHHDLKYNTISPWTKWSIWLRTVHSGNCCLYLAVHSSSSSRFV